MVNDLFVFVVVLNVVIAAVSVFVVSEMLEVSEVFVVYVAVEVSKVFVVSSVGMLLLFHYLPERYQVFLSEDNAIP